MNTLYHVALKCRCGAKKSIYLELICTRQVTISTLLSSFKIVNLIFFFREHDSGFSVQDGNSLRYKIKSIKVGIICQNLYS